MMKNDIEGIVLRKTDFRDADAILTVLSQEGKETIMARGINKIKSKNAHGCQLFTYSRFYLLNRSSQSCSTLKNVECIHSFRHIRENLLKQSIAFVLMEVLDKVELSEIDFGLDDLQIFLNELETTKDDYCLLSLFLAMITNQIGLNPNVENCCHCHSKQSIMAFSIRDGGFICSRCFKMDQHLTMNVNDLKKLRAVYNADCRHLTALMTLGTWNYRIIDLQIRFLNEYSGFTLKSVEFLECLQDMN